MPYSKLFELHRIRNEKKMWPFVRRYPAHCESGKAQSYLSNVNLKGHKECIGQVSCGLVQNYSDSQGHETDRHICTHTDTLRDIQTHSLTDPQTQIDAQTQTRRGWPTNTSTCIDRQTYMYIHGCRRTHKHIRGHTHRQAFKHDMPKKTDTNAQSYTHGHTYM